MIFGTVLDPCYFTFSHCGKYDSKMLLEIFITHFKFLYLFSFFSEITQLTIIEPRLSHVENIVVRFDRPRELWSALFHDIFKNTTILFRRNVDGTCDTKFFYFTQIIKFIQWSFFCRWNIIVPLLFLNSLLRFFERFCSETGNNMIQDLFFLFQRFWKLLVI